MDDRITPSRRTLLGSVGSGALLGVAGCLGDSSDEHVVAATARDDPDEVAHDWDPLADWLTNHTGTETQIDPVQDDGAAVSALATGHASAAYLSGGPAWVGWQAHDLEVLAAEVDEAGDTHYVATAWVRAEDDLSTFADLESRDSCHTGDLTGAGMLLPTARLAEEGLVTFETDDIQAVRGAVESYFGDPLVGGGYSGALQCLSTGHGDVAFVRESTPEDHCGEDPEEWCLDLEEYEPLVALADVPSHPFVAGADLEGADREDFTAALLALNDESGGQAILDDVLDAAGLVETDAEEHLGPYGELLEALPGIEDHFLE